MEKAVIIPKSLFPIMVERMRNFSLSEKIKVKWISSFNARWDIYRFLANRCSKEFMILYLEQDSEIFKRVSDPGLSLSYVPEVDLAVRLYEFGLLPEENRKKFVETVSNYAIDGDDTYALEGTEIRSIFTDSEFSDLAEKVRTNLIPKLTDIRLNVQSSYCSSDSPEEHMQGIFEMFSTLKNKFSENRDVVKIIEREFDLANEWIEESTPTKPKVAPRILGTMDSFEEKHDTRSIFDDIDAGDG